MKQIFIFGLLLLLNCTSNPEASSLDNKKEIANSQATEASPKIIFSKSSGALNTGDTLRLMIYDPANKTTKLLLKGTVKGRGEYNAATSPDNSKIVFHTYRYSGWKLGIGDFKNGKITNVKRLTNRPNYEYNAKFSPDGQKIAYQEYSWSSGDTDIFIADKNGKNATHFIKSKGGDRTPDWTKDSKSIVFTSGRENNYDIYIKSVVDKSIKNLTNSDALDFAPSTSKAANKIAFLSGREGKINLFVMNIDGSNLINLTSNLKTDDFKFKDFQKSGGWAYATSWSPDGKQIVFNSMVKGTLELFIVNSDGSELTRITNNNDSDIGPYWMK